jgi:pimeloyl-ACP methyl ester carboxylesterase
MPEPAAANDPGLDQRELSILTDDGVTLSAEERGSGAPIVVLHGLTGSRHYVLMGSRALERSGHRVIAYDARGHGRSTPPTQPWQGTSAGAPSPYGYRRLAGDLGAVLDATGIERAVLAGVSMGSHTIVRFALEHPERVAALAIIIPAYLPNPSGSEAILAGWDALARGFRVGGVEGFLDAYDLERVPESLRDTVVTVIRQRLGAHEHPEAVADALEAVPRSRPFRKLDELAAISVPTVVVASRDEADPRHPLVVGERYAQTIPGADLRVEEEGRSPLAWQGGQLSQIIAALAARPGHGTSA